MVFNDVYSEGYRAFHNGFGVDDNIYSHDTMEYYDWREGWFEAYNTVSDEFYIERGLDTFDLGFWK